MCCSRDCCYNLVWSLFVTLLANIGEADFVSGECQIANIISGYSLKSGVYQPNIKSLGNASSFYLCKKITCRDNIYDFGLFVGKQCYGIICDGNKDKRCMLKRDGNAEFTIFKIRKDKKTKRHHHHHHRHHHHRKASIGKHNHITHEGKSDDRDIKTNISLEQRTNSHEENKQLHRKHKKRRESVKNETRASEEKTRVSRDYPFVYENNMQQAQNYYNGRSSLPLYSTSSYSLNPSLYDPGQFPAIPPENSYQSRSNIYRNMYGLTPSLQTYNSPQLPYSDTSSLQLNTPLSSLTLSKDEKELPSTNTYGKEIINPNMFNSLSTDNSPTSQPNLREQQSSKQLERAKIDSVMFPVQSTNKYLPKLSNRTNKLLVNSNFFMNDNQNSDVHPSLKQADISNSTNANDFSVKTFNAKVNTKKSVIMEVRPLSDFPTDTDLKLDRDVIPKPEELRQLENQVVSTRDSVVDVPFSSRTQIPVKATSFPQGLFDTLSPSNASTKRTFTPRKTYQTLLQQRKITGHSLFQHVPSRSHAVNFGASAVVSNKEGEIDSVTNKKSLLPPISLLHEVVKKDPIYRSRIDVPRPSAENVKKAIFEINELKSQVERLLEENSAGKTVSVSFSDHPSSNAKKSSVVDSPVKNVENSTTHINKTHVQNVNFVNSNDVDTNSDNANSNLGLEIGKITKDSKVDIGESYDVTNSGCVNAIGLSDQRRIDDRRFTSSSYMDNFPPSKGRLRLSENGEEYVGSWCSTANNTVQDEPPYLQVDLGARTMVCRLAVQGDDNVKKWVKRFNLMYSDDAVNWDPYREGGKAKIFFGNEDEKDVTYRTFKNPLVARYVRFEPTKWEGDSPCMRVELYNTEQGNDGERPSSRSDIPRGHSGLIEDLDFEKMDDQIALDRSSFGNNGFLYGGTKVFDTHSSCRHAIKIPLGADIVIDGSIMKTRPRKAITIALWVQLNRVEGVHSIFDTVGGHSKHDLGQFHFEIVGGDVRWFHRNETEDEIFSLITDHKLIKPGEWNHIAATYDSNNGDTVIYVNGTEQIRGKGHGLISNDWSQRVGIGRHKGVRFLDGQIDEFKMYDFAITPEHVDELFSKCDFSKYFCGTTLTDDKGSILSPAYPNTVEGPVECIWNIQGKSGETVELDMTEFKLGYKADCGRANLEVRDTVNDAIIGDYCGASLTPRRVRSHSNYMYLKYYTDGALKGEKFKVNYARVSKRQAKKNSVSRQCLTSDTMSNVTLVGGAKAGNFTDLGSTADMQDCKERCCNLEDCQVAFLIDDSCYAVNCFSNDMCRTRKAKSTALKPQLAYIKDRIGLALEDNKAEDKSPPLKENNLLQNDASAKKKTCKSGDAQTNVTLVGGIKSGNFTSHGAVDNFADCVSYCCGADDCDLAFMVKRTCFSLHCADESLCKTRPAKPSSYNPTVAFITRSKPVAVQLEQKPNVSPPVKTAMAKEHPISHETTAAQAAPDNRQTCRDMRLSKVYGNVTLSGGIGAGEFTDKGHVTSMDECVQKCCSSDSCNVAFVIKDTCFTVKCRSYDDCALKSAISDYYNPQIVFVNWNPPKDLGESASYQYKGCWRDFDISAFALPLLEGTDPKLSEPYKKRMDPVNDCSSVSQSRGFKVFAIQNGGACFSGTEAEQMYKRYGKSEACKAGRGGPFANSVYKSFDDGSIIALGCWADLQDRAFRRMEKSDPLLLDAFDARPDPVGTCAKVAQKMRTKYFAMQKGGQCFVAKTTGTTYNKYSPSRKCKYGLGGQMANDVYMLKQNFTTGNAVAKNTTTTTTATTNQENADGRINELGVGETVYKEEISGAEHIRYVYKVDTPLENVTLASAINAGTFEDKGKMANMRDCVKACGVSADCNVAFMLSEQCFNVHCYSDDTCRTKPAYSAFYRPQLAFVKHRVIRKKNTDNNDNSTAGNTTSVTDKFACKPITELSNVTFVAGINAGNFSDMGNTKSMNECINRCCRDKKCHVAFKIQSDCYGVRCFSKDSCQTRAAKNTILFSPQMAVIRHIRDPLEAAVEETPTVSTTTTALVSTTTASGAAPSTTASGAVSSTGGPARRCPASMWDEEIIRNETLIGGINAGDFRDHGQVDAMADCMDFCCGESDCDLSFMIDRDCYTVKCYKSSLCLTRPAKPTTFTTLIAFKKATRIALNKANLTELLKQPETTTDTKPLTLEKEPGETAYASMKSELVHAPSPQQIDITRFNNVKNVTGVDLAEYIDKLLNGIEQVIGFVKETLTEMTDDRQTLEKTFSLLYHGLSTTPTAPSSPTTRPLRTIIPHPQDDDYLGTAGLKATTPATSVTESTYFATPTFGSPKKHSCKAEPIIYNATLRLGMHSGLFTKLGRVKLMDDCIERCCRSSNADVAYMLGPFCFAVKCKTREMCRPSPAMYSDIKSLNLNPAISFLSKTNAFSGPVTEPTDSDILDTVYDSVSDTDSLIQEVIRNLTAEHSVLRSQLKLLLTTTPSTPHLRRRPPLPEIEPPSFGLGLLPDRNDVRMTSSDMTSSPDMTLTRPTLSFDTIMREDGMRKNILMSQKGLIRGQSTPSEEGVCNDSPINYNVTLRGGVHAGKFTELGEGMGMRDCVGKCCETPLCDVAFMFSDKCYAVGCYDEASCQAVLAKPSSLNPRVAYVTKYRASTPNNNGLTALDTVPSGILFDMNEKTSPCSVGAVKHGPVYTNKTLLGGMKSGNFSYLGSTNDITSCLSRCCSTDACDMAYLVDRKQCFAVNCFTPELCQISDHNPFANKYIEISKLFRQQKTNRNRKHKRGMIMAYMVIGLVAVATGLSGLLWAVMIYVKRSRLKSKNRQSNNDDDDDVPRPD